MSTAALRTPTRWLSRNSEEPFEPDEYAEGHIAGSTLIPLGQLANRISKLPQDRPIVAVCRSGNRSSVALSVLTRAGFTNVLNLRGGMLAWARGGLPVKRGK